MKKRVKPKAIRLRLDKKPSRYWYWWTDGVWMTACCRKTEPCYEHGAYRS